MQNKFVLHVYAMKKYLKSQIVLVIINILLSICVSASLLTLPLITQDLIDSVRNEVAIDYLYILYYIGAVLLILFFELLSKLSYHQLTQNIQTELRGDLYESLINKEYSVFAKKDVSEYISIFNNDIKIIMSDYFSTILYIIKAGFSVLIYLGLLFYYDWLLGLAIVIGILLSITIPKLTEKTLSSRRSKQMTFLSSYVGKLTDLLNGFKLINKLTRPNFKNEHDESNISLRIHSLRFERFKALIEIFGGLSLYLLNILAFASGIFLISQQRITIGEFIASIAVIELLIFPVQDVVYGIINVVSSKEIKTKLTSLLEIDKSTDLRDLNAITDGISLRNVQYSYQNFTLDINHLNLKKGKKYLIIGESGSGKSTLLNILVGRITPQSGTITFDDVQLSSINPYSLVSEITQNEYLFNASPKDNVTIFDTYKDDNLSKYIKDIGAESIFERDVIGSESDAISGGESNKIAIIRSLMRKSNILIFDEVFSALDRKTSDTLTDYLVNEKEITMISVTHNINPSNLIKFDEIIVLKDGKIVAQDTPSALLENNLILNKMYS